MKPKLFTCGIVCVTLVCLGVADAAAASQPNSWISSSTTGLWQNSSSWSLGAPPATANQTGIFVTNAVSKTVTINSSTPAGNMTINDLTVKAPVGVVNTLQITNVGAATPLRILNGCTISSGGAVLITNSVLRVEGANKLCIMDGSVTVRSGASIISTNTGTFTAVGNVSTGTLSVIGGSMLPSKLYVGVGAGSQGTVQLAGGTTRSSGLTCAGCRVGSAGTMSVTAGQLTVTNDFLELGANGPGQLTVSGGTVVVRDFTVGTFAGSRGTLTVASGSFQTLLDFSAGYNPGPTGTIWVTGGELRVGGQMILGLQPPSVGRMTISNGTVTASKLFVGDSTGNSGSLALYGGMMMVTSTMYVGYCPVSATGSVLIAGGSLFVTNSTGTAVLDLSGGTLTLSSGLLVVDKFVVTNTCARFVYTGGTLLYTESLLSSSLDADGDGLMNWWEDKYGLGPLNPFGIDGAAGDPDGDGLTNLQEFNAGTSPISGISTFRVIAIARETNNIRVTWKTAGGRTNQLQVATTSTGSYSTNFVNLGPVMIIPGTGDATANYLDIGAATNATPRYYRVRLVP